MRTILAGLLGAVLTVLMAIAFWLTVVYTGAYNVAATDPHADAARWTLETTMRRSVSNRATDAQLPDALPDDLVARGAGAYAEYCAHCHGAPGQDPAEWSRGMRPEPPHLTEAATEWTAGEIRWIVDNGIKMSGMPAFGPDHEDEEILAITAFVQQLPGLAPADYAAMVGDAPSGGHRSESE
jgi:mono/diheme cytochrome c family protein